MPKALAKKQIATTTTPSDPAGLLRPSATSNHDRQEPPAFEEETRRVHFVGGRMLVPCRGGTLLEVLVVKPRVAGPEPTVPASEFMRGLGKNCRLFTHPVAV